MKHVSQSHTSTAIALVASEHSQLLPEALDLML